jgi:hypothetical protein
MTSHQINHRQVFFRGHRQTALVGSPRRGPKVRDAGIACRGPRQCVRSHRPVQVHWVGVHWVGESRLECLVPLVDRAEELIERALGLGFIDYLSCPLTTRLERFTAGAGGMGPAVRGSVDTVLRTVG